MSKKNSYTITNFQNMNKLHHLLGRLRASLMAVALMAAAGIPAAAQTTKEALVVYKTDGKKIAYVLETAPSVTFGTNTLNIDSRDISDTHKVAEVVSWRFEQVDPSSVGLEDTADESRITITPSEVIISGLKAGATVTAADLQGRVLATVVTPESGVAAISTERFEPGVYVIAASDFHSFKIYKR